MDGKYVGSKTERKEGGKKYLGVAATCVPTLTHSSTHRNGEPAPSPPKKKRDREVLNGWENRFFIFTPTLLSPARMNEY